ncbi:MAG: hypothetical protein ACPGU4_12785 [Flavobacteriales bacterium]
MKKQLLISVVLLTTLSLVGFGVMNSAHCFNTHVQANADSTKLIADVNFLYDFGPRFDLTVTKQELAEVSSMKDLYHEESIVEYMQVAITVVENEGLTAKRVTGGNETLNDSQLDFLKSFDYSTNFQIGGNVVRKNAETGELENGFSRPHITVVPENQAEFEEGRNALLSYLKDGSREAISELNQKNLQPGKIYFTISVNGTISGVKMLLSCGYSSVDDLMVELISKNKGRWLPASNSEGEIVEQDLVFSFGDMGC